MFSSGRTIVVPLNVLRSMSKIIYKTKGDGLYLSPFLSLYYDSAHEVNKMASKFNVSTDTSKRTYDGVVYDSAIEMKFMRDYIVPRLESGELIKAERQIKYELLPAFKHDGTNVRAITYVADFVITYADGHTVVIDIKGMPDSVAKLKRKLFWYKYPNVDYIWMSYSKKYGGWITYETLTQARKEDKKKRAAENELKGT